MGCCSSKPSVATLVNDAKKSLAEFDAAQEAGNSEEAHQALERAVDQYGQALDKARDEHHESYTGIAINCASTLDKYTSMTHKTADRTAIGVLSATRNEFKDQAKKPALYPRLLGSLADALLNQYNDPGIPGDATDKQRALKSAGDLFEEVRAVVPDAASNPQYSRSLIGSASVLCLEWERLGNNPERLEKPSTAISMLERIPEAERVNHQPAYFRQLASAYDHRYRQTRTTIDEELTMSPDSRADLEQAIKYNIDALDYVRSQGQADGEQAPCLINLARQLLEREVRTNTQDQANLSKAETYIADADKLLQESDPANLVRLCQEVKTNIENYRNHKATLDYGQSIPARRQSTTTSATSVPHATRQAPQAILEEGKPEVAEPGNM